MESIANKNAKLPKNVDFDKTYQYVFYKKFIYWANSLELDIDTIKNVIIALVKYGHRKNILDRGAAILSHKRICEIALNELEDIEQNRQFKIELLENSASVINKYSVQELLSKPRIGAYNILTSLYASNIIDKMILISSKKCRIALKEMDKDERRELPSVGELLIAKKKIDKDKELKSALSSFLGDDFIL